MGRPRRIQFEGAFYHIYNRGVEKRPIFMEERDRKMFLQFLADAVSEFQLRLIAYCLMENHYHLFLQTLKANLQTAMKNLQGKYAQYVNFRYERVGPLFQGRYNSRLVNADQYALALTRYIHRNPLEAGSVQKLDDYPWSSYPSYSGKMPIWNWLDASWLLGQFGSETNRAQQNFIQFHEQVPTHSESSVLAHASDLTGVRPSRV
ncbi:MAG: transposase [Candidatus Omnitrophica bacterium]|nr:transposase [Candidatus Omnitrophota bacterium]